MQFSTAVRNAELDAIEETIGISAVLKVYDLTAGAPTDCSDSIAGTILATIQLPEDWMDNAFNAVKGLAGVWEDTYADDTGTPDYFRIYETDGINCHIQGTVTVTGDGGDMTFDDITFIEGQLVSMGTFNLTAGNA